jgi:hypothetical protein
VNVDANRTVPAFWSGDRAHFEEGSTRYSVEARRGVRAEAPEHAPPPGPPARGLFARGECLYRFFAETRQELRKGHSCVFYSVLPHVWLLREEVEQVERQKCPA